MKNLALFYFVGLAGLSLIMDAIYSHFVFFDIIFVILAGLPLFVKKKWMFQAFGGVMSLISLYIVFAIFISMGKGVQARELQPFWTYGIGYVLSLITLSFGLLMTGVINGSRRKNIIITSN